MTSDNIKHKSIWKGIWATQWPSFTALGVVFTCLAISLFITDNYVLKATIQSIQWIAIGIQWLWLVRVSKRRAIDGLNFDREQLVRLADPNMVDFMGLKFLVPHRGSKFSYPMQRLQNKTVLKIYGYGENMGNGSLSKICATEKDMFELRLRGLIETTDIDLAHEGIKYLTDRERKVVT